MMHVIDPIPLTLGYEEIRGEIRGVSQEWAKRLEELAGTAQPLIFAKAVYKPAYVDSKLTDEVVIDGIRFKSEVLRKNLDEVGRFSLANSAPGTPVHPEKRSTARGWQGNTASRRVGSFILTGGALFYIWKGSCFRKKSKACERRWR